MPPKGHSILSASSSDRWLHCPPSARLCETYEDKGSDYAAEGTDAHALCEYKLLKALGMEATDPTKSLDWYNAEMEDCATGYASFIMELLEDAKQTCSDPVVLIEQRVDFSRWVEQGFGTSDAILISDGTMHVIDYKHGLGILVCAEDNPQMKCYALGALELFDDIYDIDTVSMTIYQPRRQNVSTYEVSKEDLYQWADEALKPTANLAFAGDGNFLCGEWCGFCKAKHECRTRAEANLLLAQIDDCNAGNIDMIITKSISRFARNTLDCLKYIRQLKDMNIPVLFEKESINTMDAKGEVLITIMASLAQQESQSLSQNVKMGLQYRYQQGKVQINHNRFLGYTKDADGNLVIDPEQAETVKRIYREYLEGLSMDKIAAGLERDGILTGAGGKKWHTSTINKILRNEKYIGDALLQKTYTTDFLNKTRVKNNGLVPQYYVEGDHEAIIPKDIYLQVQEELVRRRVGKTSANGKKRNYSCNHCFSQIVICGECGEMFRRLHWNNRGVKSIVWRCISRLESTGLECHARTINELVLQDVVVKAINQMLGDKSSYQAQLQLNIAAVIRASQATAIDSIDEKLMALQQELIQKANSKEDYDEIADEIFRLRELRQKTTVDTAVRDEQIKRINDLQDYISQQTTLLTEFDEALVRRWVKQITIWDDRITVELKSGVSIDVDP